MILSIQIALLKYQYILFSINNNMSNMDDPTNSINLCKFSAIFAQNYNSPDFENFTAVFGHSKAGKSVLIDLFAGKQLMIYQNVELMTNVVVQKDNCAAQYPPIYIVKGKPAMVMLQCFTLDVQTPSLQVLKLIFLSQLIKQTKKGSFVILVEESQKEQILIFVERFLQNLGITSNKKDQNLNFFKEFAYLMITKTENDQFDGAKDIIKELSNQSENENVKEILNYIVDNDRIEQFRIQTPQENFADKIRNKFQVKSFDANKIMKILEKSTLKEISSIFTQEDQRDLLKFFEEVVKMVEFLIQYAISEERAHQRQYENIAKKIYPDHKRKNQTDTMLGKWSKSSIGKLNISLKIGIINGKNVDLQTFADVVISLLKCFQQFSEAKQDYQQIIGRILFVVALDNWLTPSVFKPKFLSIVESFKATLLKISDNSQTSKPQPPKIKPISRPIQKKKQNPVFNSFRQAFEQCKSNRQTIDICLKTIKQKERDANFDYFQVIYYIKLVKDLLEDFDNKVQSDHHLFTKELLELSLYIQNYFDFENYLKIAIRNKSLTQNEANTLLKTLNSCGKYDYCEKLVDYLLAQCTDQANFERFALLKASFKGKINQEYLGKDKQEQGRPEIKKRILTLSYDGITKKGKGSDLDDYLGGKDFERYLAVKE